VSNKKPQLMPVPNAQAGVFFVDGQYVFKWLDDAGTEYTKFVSPASARTAFAKEPADSGWLPAGVMRCGNGSRGAWMVKWFEPAVYKFTIDAPGAPTKPLRVVMPSLIWFGQKTHYYIFATKESRFKATAELYHAPLPNAGRHGLICFGDNPHPDVAKGGFESTWKMFWEAPFSDHHDDNKSRSEPKSIIKKLVELARYKAKHYPLGDLVKAHTTLEQAILRLTRRDKDGDALDID